VALGSSQTLTEMSTWDV